MNDAPKKKAAPQKSKPKTEKVDPQSSTDKKDDAALKAAVLDAALPHAAFDGFTDKVLQNAGAVAGLEKNEIARLFPEGPLGLITYYSQSVDAQMQAQLEAMDLPSMKIRARISQAVKVRLAILKPHKEAARRAAATLSLPMHAGLAAKLMYHTVDAMWRAAGDASTDFNFYTKRGILAGVYGATLVRWFADASLDEAATNAFLAARIENVMQFEKLNAKAKDALSNIPAFADWAKKKAPL